MEKGWRKNDIMSLPTKNICLPPIFIPIWLTCETGKYV
jgi:hypothetical protein